MQWLSLCCFACSSSTVRWLRLSITLLEVPKDGPLMLLTGLRERLSVLVTFLVSSSFTYLSTQNLLMSQKALSFFEISYRLGRRTKHFIKVWKPLPSKRILKSIGRSPKGKVQRRQYLKITCIESILTKMHCSIQLSSNGTQRGGVEEQSGLQLVPKNKRRKGLPNRKRQNQGCGRIQLFHLQLPWPLQGWHEDRH